MITGSGRFNLYLLCLLAVVLGCGCQGMGKKDDKSKRFATFRVHLTGSPDFDHVAKISVYRASPVELVIQSDPFLTEAQVSEAKIVDVAGGGFDLQIKLNQQGSMLLQNYSAANPGKQFAVFTQFGERKEQSRWLAAPFFRRMIANGVLQFAADVSREEAEAIVLGLNNVAKKVDAKSKW